MASDVNSCVLVGRLTRDCGTDPNGKDFSYTQGGMCIAKVSIAVNRSQKQNDGSWADVASFFNVTIFGKTAENLKPYLTKGKQICVVGRLQQDRWTDQQGQNHSAVSIIADNVQLVGGQSQNNNAPQYNPNTVYPTAQAAQMASAQSNPQQYASPQGYQAPQQPQNLFAQQPQMNQQQNFPPPTMEGFVEDIPF